MPVLLCVVTLRRKGRPIMDKNPVLFDGAMGTQLQLRGLKQDPAILNLTAPDAIINIHRAYINAGVDIITANTFGAYSHKYANSKELIRAAMKNGRTAIGDGGQLLALDIGPTGLMLEPYGDATPEEVHKLISEAIEAGAEDADIILIETMMDLAELEIAVKAASAASLPIFATMTFDKNGRTMMGTSLSDMVDLLEIEPLGVDALGMNCGFGPDAYVPLAAELARLTDMPIIVQPNAGLPTAGGQYDLTIEEFANAMNAINADFMGGCCGTSPAHIAALAQRVPQ